MRKSEITEGIRCPFIHKVLIFFTEWVHVGGNAWQPNTHMSGSVHSAPKLTFWDLPLCVMGQEAGLWEAVRSPRCRPWDGIRDSHPVGRQGSDLLSCHLVKTRPGHGPVEASDRPHGEPSVPAPDPRFPAPKPARNKGDV